MSCTSSPASRAALALCSARRRTSSATTPKPLPCLPARAASIAAFRASRFVISASSRMDPMNPVIRRLIWPSCCTLAELSPTNALSATSRWIASRICVRFRLATSLAAVDARAAPAPSSDTRRETWARLSVASRPPETSPSSRRTPSRITPVDAATADAAPFSASAVCAIVARHIVDDDGLTVCRDFLAKGVCVLGRFAPRRSAPGGTVHERHLPVVQAINAEIAPIHEPVREPFDALEGILETDIRRDHRFHRVDLVELLGGNRFLDHLLEQQTEKREDETHEQPRSDRPGDDRAD